MTLQPPEAHAATADAIAGEVRRASRHALPPGTPCPNCRAPLQGPWCHACGQKGEDYQRAIGPLTAEALKGLTHLDGRVWKTLPRLAVRPGQLTRDYLDGRRASQIPPFRLFLVTLLLVFFTGGLNFGLTKVRFRLMAPGDPQAIATLSPQDRADYQTVVKPFETGNGSGLDKAAAGRRGRFWAHRLKAALEKPEAFFQVLETWGHRLAIAFLPIAALMLSVLYLGRKDTYVFDHLIFSMHSLSFQGLLLSTLFLVSAVWSGAWLLLWISPIHLFFHMRGTYGSSIAGTLIRMVLLIAGATVAFGLLLSLLLIIGLISVK
jgi:hypothetical protein